MTQVAVAVINHNTRDYLRACLATVQAENPSEVVVIDNASSDGSADLVTTEYPQFTLIANKANPGYGAAANQAIAACTAEYVLLLNSDTLLEPGVLEALSSYLDQHRNAAIVGPRLGNPDQTLQASCYPFPTPLNIFLEESGLGRLIRYVPILRDRYLRTWSHTDRRIVPWVLGAALMIRRDPFEAVGGFDESFFMYFEEVDLCYRLHVAGWQVHFAPVTAIMHVGGASTSQCRAEMTKLVFASAAHFYQRHYVRRRMLHLRIVVAMVMLAKIVRAIVRRSCARDALQRSRLTEDLLVWSRLLGDVRHGWMYYD